MMKSTLDLSKICQGWIYALTNKVNGKMYIGKTNNYERRKNEHIKYCGCDSCIKLRRALLKYGIGNFEMKSIVTFKAINVDVLNKILNALERYYIAKYDTYKNGYNATLGGEGICGFHITEEQIRKRIASRGEFHHSKETKDAIRNKLRGHKPTVVNKKAVLQYSLDGVFIQEFSSHSDALRAVNGKNNGALDNVLDNNHKQSYGYMWRSKDDTGISHHIEPYVKKRNNKRVYRYSKDGLYINTYDSVNEAAESTGITIRAIYNSLNKNLKIHVKDFWSYNPPINGKYKGWA